ncbi:hypothetical protein ACHAWF_011317 [Thalassiosira exigua]
MTLFQKPPHAVTYQEKDAISFIAEVRYAFLETSVEEDENRDEIRMLGVDVLQDLRENLVSSLREIEHESLALSRETREHRKNVLALVYGQSSRNADCLPPPLSKELESLRVTLKETPSIEDGGEIDLLSAQLMKSLDDARRCYDSLSSKTTELGTEWGEKDLVMFKKVLSTRNSNALRGDGMLLHHLKQALPTKSEEELSAHLKHHRSRRANKQRLEVAAREFKKMCQEIENNGMGEVENLRRQFSEKRKMARARTENDLRRKEMHLRVQAMRQERDGHHQARKEEETQNIVSEAGDCFKKEVDRTQRMLEAKQKCMNRRAQQIQQLDAYNNPKGDLAVEVEKLKLRHSNRERTNYRQERMKNKVEARRKAEDEAFRMEEKRLESLLKLAASVPYYKSIMDTSADIHKSTEARKNDVYGGRTGLADFQCGRMNSFTNEKVFADANFRLGSALHEAGVAHSTYARDVIRNAIPRTEARTTGIKPY